MFPWPEFFFAVFGLLIWWLISLGFKWYIKHVHDHVLWLPLTLWNRICKPFKTLFLLAQDSHAPPKPPGDLPGLHNLPGGLPRDVLEYEACMQLLENTRLENELQRLTKDANASRASEHEIKRQWDRLQTALRDCEADGSFSFISIEQLTAKIYNVFEENSNLIDARYDLLRKVDNISKDKGKSDSIKLLSIC